MATFSEKEIRFLADTDFLLTKQDINQKVTALLGEAEQKLKGIIQSSDFPFPDQAFLKAGKISRGEQYQGLPYWILDYPRKFSKEATFSFRTMVWWGHEISCFFHIGGTDLENFRAFILKNFQKDPSAYISVHSSPWEYHFGPDNYQNAFKIGPEEVKTHMDQFGFHKMTDRLPLEQIQDLPDFAATTFAKMLDSLR
ncbi:MAG: hypothetical protein R8G66_16195 [Cytophagales bacterium]|nr:hypothetical protein [Cytophagales bacterium]